MSNELEILEKLKVGDSLTEDDKAQVYSGEIFIAPGSYYGTTLLHQIVLLPNSMHILSGLDFNLLSDAASISDGSSSSFTPLALLIDSTIDGHSMYPNFEPIKDVICFLVGLEEDLGHIRFLVSDYAALGEGISEILDECEAVHKANPLVTMHDAVGVVSMSVAASYFGG